jgi:uncharacterized membrane-anchored protein
MVTTKLVTAEQAHQGASIPAAPYDTSAYDDTVEGSIDTVRAEIDDAFHDMKEFHNQEPDEIMRMCGGHSARLSEIRVRIQRVEDWKRQWRGIRTREIEPAIEELERQYAIASRLHSIREHDWKIETGER